MEPTRTVEDLRDWWDPDRPLGRTDELLRHCALADAQIVWASRRAQLEAAVNDARINMEHYRHLTYCQLTDGTRNFSAMPDDEKCWLIEGVDQFGRFSNGQNPHTNFEQWQDHERDYTDAVAAYDDFRRNEAEFQQQYTARSKVLRPLLEKADALKALARANVRQCTGSGATPTTRLGVFDDPVKELNAQVLDLKAEMLGFGCSIPMANSFIAGIQSEIRMPYRKWDDFISFAERQFGSGDVCQPCAANRLVAQMHEAAANGFGSLPSMQMCLDTQQERQTVGRSCGSPQRWTD